MNTVKDTRIQVVTSPKFHVELFTQYPNDITNRSCPVLKMGKFRIRREDNSIGERYFVSDIREIGETTNAVLIYNTIDKMRIKLFGVEPNYSCARMEVYRMACYTELHPTLVLDISVDGVNVYDK